MNDTTPKKNNQLFRVRFGLIVLAIGFILLLFGIDPGIFRADRSLVTGFVQISVFLIGLAILCVGGNIAINALWNGQQKSILADIGIRLVATGYVICFAAGLADVFGIGSHPFPNIPSFGPVQALGVMIGEAMILVGFIAFIPSPRKKKEVAEFD